MPILKPLLVALVLLGTPHLLAAQATSAPRLPATSAEAHAGQYFADLTQRLREVYQAPSDGRAISLLSNTITEFTARKKGLLAEAGVQRPAPTGRAELPAGSAVGKMAARRHRNPALEYAFRRFEQAQLLTLDPFRAAAE